MTGPLPLPSVSLSHMPSPNVARVTTLHLNNTGAVTAAAAFAVNLGVENIAGFKFWVTLTVIQDSG